MYITGKQEASRHILIIDGRLAAPDRDSGASRMYNMLLILRELGYTITFLGSLPTAPPTTDVQRWQAEIVHLQGIGVANVYALDAEAVDQYVEHWGSHYDVVLLSGVYTATRHIGGIKRHAPDALVIFDTVDLHFVRIYREARLHKNAVMLRHALALKQQELAVARVADRTLVVSSLEQAVLRLECPEVQVHVVSIIHQVQPSTRPFQERKDLIFVGTFTHRPNVDAVLFFLTQIFEQVAQQLGDIRLYIIGGDPPAEIRGLAASNVIVTGHVPDLRPYFDSCKVLVAPLRFGAGVKGKVLTSMSFGVPVVMSSVAAEGLPVEHGRDGLVADDPDAFCAAVVRLYQDEALWNRCSQQGGELVARHYSPSIAREQLVAALAEVRRR